MMAHTFNPSSQKAKGGGSIFLKPIWSTPEVPGQMGYLECC